MKRISRRNMDKKREIERRHRFALTLLYSCLVFGVLLLALVISAVILTLLVRSPLLSKVLNPETSGKDMLLFMAIVSAIIGALLALLTSRIPLAPVNKIVNRLNRLAAGDFSARLSFGKTLERHPTIRELTKSFNTLATELESTEMLRSDFMDNFSHEFKTPIVSIAGFAKLLRRGNLTDAQKDEYLEVIEEESLRLASLATNVLRLTRVENQTILTDVSTYNLSEQLRSCVLLLEDQWAKKNLTFALDFPEHTVFANEELLKQVFINLLDNAVKFSVHGGEIAVEIREEADAVTVSITNEGIEIPKEAREKIFRKFYQAEESHAGYGSGVGLAVVKRITDLHGGTIHADCGDGKTTFTLSLPQRGTR